MWSTSSDKKPGVTQFFVDTTNWINSSFQNGILCHSVRIDQETKHSDHFVINFVRE